MLCVIVSDIENGTYYNSHISRLPRSGERNGEQNVSSRTNTFVVDYRMGLTAGRVPKIRSKKHMRVICVDDDEQDLLLAEELCRKLPGVDEVRPFSDPRQVPPWLSKHRADVVLLDIDMPGRTGLELAAEVRNRWANTALIFVTGHPEFALEAYGVHPTAYLIKPLDRERLAAEMDYTLLTRPARDIAHITAQTFGNFEFLVDGKAVGFSRAKAKELLALLVDRRGGGISRRQAFTEMWEDREYDQKMQKYFDVVLHALAKTLKDNGVSEIMELNGGYIRIRPELLDCDLYHFLSGDADALMAYNGEYMNGYSWANMTEAYLTMG